MTITKTNYSAIDELVFKEFGELAWYSSEPIELDEEDSKNWEEAIAVYTDEEPLQDDQIATIFIKGDTLYLHKWF